MIIAIRWVNKAKRVSKKAFIIIGNRQNGIKKISLLPIIKEKELIKTIRIIREIINVIFLLSLKTSILNCFRNKNKIIKAINISKDCPNLSQFSELSCQLSPS